MNEFYRKGFIKEPKEETLENGEFLVTIMVGDNPQMIQNYFDICCAEKGKDPLSLKIIKIGDSYTAYRTGGMNSVLRGDNEKESLDLLKLTVTDEEISHLLKYGNKYISDMPVMARWMFGNDFWVKTKQMLL